MTIRILHGDCREVMATLPEASVDAIVCDPPYELGFMGKGWDRTGVANDVETWRQALRVLKPGGHLLAFSGTRTYHRMVCAIEDAGFEIRDQIGWLFGSGFPKSLDVSKAIDKAAGAEREVVGFDAAKAAQQTRAVGTAAYGDFAGNVGEVTVPATDAARRWQGWGTALKPAWEPIVVARKPLIGTVAENVLTHGTGALNIDGCRVPTGDKLGGGNENLKPRPHTDGWDRPWMHDEAVTAAHSAKVRANVERAEALGRWPANLLHDGSDEVLAAFPQASGAVAPVRGTEPSGKTADIFGEFAARAPSDRRDGGGSAARFFWSPKASRADRNEGLDGMPTRVVVHQGQTLNNGSGKLRNGDGKPSPTANHHPTVKPTDLMRYLCRLVTPPGGTVLDPFMGSGSTLKAAEMEGFSAIGIELDPAYVEIARRRIAADTPLFADVEVQAAENASDPK